MESTIDTIYDLDIRNKYPITLGTPIKSQSCRYSARQEHGGQCHGYCSSFRGYHMSLITSSSD